MGARLIPSCSWIPPACSVCCEVKGEERESEMMSDRPEREPQEHRALPEAVSLRKIALRRFVRGRQFRSGPPSLILEGPLLLSESNEAKALLQAQDEQPRTELFQDET